MTFVAWSLAVHPATPTHLLDDLATTLPRTRTNAVWALLAAHPNTGVPLSSLPPVDRPYALRTALNAHDGAGKRRVVAHATTQALAHAAADHPDCDVARELARRPLAALAGQPQRRPIAAPAPPHGRCSLLPRPRVDWAPTRRSADRPGKTSDHARWPAHTAHGQARTAEDRARHTLDAYCFTQTLAAADTNAVAAAHHLLDKDAASVAPALLACAALDGTSAHWRAWAVVHARVDCGALDAPTTYEEALEAITRRASSTAAALVALPRSVTSDALAAASAALLGLSSSGRATPGGGVVWAALDVATHPLASPDARTAAATALRVFAEQRPNAALALRVTEALTASTREPGAALDLLTTQDVTTLVENGSDDVVARVTTAVGAALLTVPGGLTADTVRAMRALEAAFRGTLRELWQTANALAA